MKSRLFTHAVCAFAADRRGNFAGKTGKTAEKECELYEDTGLAEDDAAGLPREGSLHGVPGGELLRFLQGRKGLLDGVAITGGEPLLRKDLPDLLRAIRELGFAVKVDTNGNHPDALEALLREGLVDYVAMDIKNSPEKYALTAGLDSLDLAPIRRSVRLLMEGDTPYEFRTTVVDQLHKAADFEAIGRWIAGARAYFLQPFTDRDSVPFAGFSAPTREALDKYASIMRVYVPYTQIRGL